MNREYLLSLPLFLEVGTKTKKKYYINLNGYRNWCYRVSNMLKQQYKQEVEGVIKDLPTMNKISTTYYIYYPTNRTIDLDNIGSISAKFFQDALVSYGKIIDDNYKFITDIKFEFGGVDKDNPRVDVVIIDKVIEAKD